MAVWIIQSRADEVARIWPDSKQMALYSVDAEGQFYLSVKEAGTKKSRWEIDWHYFTHCLNRKIESLAAQSSSSNFEIIAIRDKVLPLLHEQKRMIMERKDFDSQCSKNETLRLAGPSNYDSTLLVLGATGDLLWYHKIPIVSQYIIVDPSRWAKFIFSILGRDNMAKNDGRFDRNDLELAIINSEIHPDEKVGLPDIFIRLLCEYQIIFEKPDAPSNYVVPQYLPDQPLEQYLKNLLPLTLVVQYEHYMPFWRIAHFITQKATIRSNQKPYYWRYGIIYYDQGCTVMVRLKRPLGNNDEVELEAKLYIHIDGPAGTRIQLLIEIFNFFGQVYRFESPHDRISLVSKNDKQDLINFIDKRDSIDHLVLEQLT